MKAQFVRESLEFERGQDPKSSMGIGLSKTVYNKWEELQKSPGMGSITIDQSLNSRFHLTIHVSQIGNSAGESFKKAKEIFGPLIGDFYNIKGGEIRIVIPEEFEKAFIDAYNMRYPGWPITEAIEFNRTGDVLRDVGVGVKRNIPKYSKELSNDIIEEFYGWGNGNQKLDELWNNLADDLEEYGYNTLEDYFEEEKKDPIIENSLETYKWGLSEFAKQFVWKAESIEAIVNILLFYKAFWADINFDSVVRKIDKALKLNWGMEESINFERGGDPLDTLNIGKLIGISGKVKELEMEATKRGFHKSKLSENPYAAKDHPKFDDLLSWKDNKGNYILLYSLKETSYKDVGKYRVIAGNWPENFKDSDNDPYPPGSYDDNLSSWIYYSIPESPKNPWERAFPHLDESLGFERGREPKRALRVGHAHLYPDKDLFIEIHEFWENLKEGDWPYGFEGVSPIKWEAKEPNFRVLFKNHKGEQNEYVIYLAKEEGVVMFYDYYVDGGDVKVHRDEEYHVEDFKHFIRILETNHYQYLPR
jgi:hypothetical protein